MVEDTWTKIERPDKMMVLFRHSCGYEVEINPRTTLFWKDVDLKGELRHDCPLNVVPLGWELCEEPVKSEMVPSRPYYDLPYHDQSGRAW